MTNTKTWFWVLLDVLIGLVALNIIFFVMPMLWHLGNSFSPVRTITVYAEGKATVTPDLAESSFSVVSQGKNPQDLADSNNQKISAVIQFLKSEGVSDGDIRTTNYNLSPDYRYDKNIQRNYIVGYTLTQTVSVKMRDFKKVPEIIGGLTPLGVNQIGGINFSVESNERFLSVARANAFGEARAKAESMAAGARVRLGRVLNVSESQSSSPIPYYGYGAAMKSEAVPSVAIPTIEPGSQEIKDTVTITYELQ
ncbi:MAG: SIMPL domain-containing protein [Candidatus Liptonbacteria bacterium]|nr:SIMPL domain-containing protein [Candidatus Liptonbacteria bacterium]